VSLVGVSTGVTSLIIGAIVSIVKSVTCNRLLSLVAPSVTLIKQLVCVHVESVLNVIVLFPEIAHVVDEEQSQE
jgi:hypothetical protein